MLKPFKQKSKLENPHTKTLKIPTKKKQLFRNEEN